MYKTLRHQCPSISRSCLHPSSRRTSTRSIGSVRRFRNHVGRVRNLVSIFTSIKSIGGNGSVLNPASVFKGSTSIGCGGNVLNPVSILILPPSLIYSNGAVLFVILRSRADHEPAPISGQRDRRAEFVVGGFRSEELLKQSRLRWRRQAAGADGTGEVPTDATITAIIVHAVHRVKIHRAGSNAACIQRILGADREDAAVCGHRHRGSEARAVNPTFHGERQAVWG